MTKPGGSRGEKFKTQEVGGEFETRKHNLPEPRRMRVAVSDLEFSQLLKIPNQDKNGKD